MAYFDRDEDTICALTTGAGQSGIAVIRVSGPEALHQVKQLCSFLPEIPESHRVYYGILKDSSQSFAVDEVLVSFFAKGKSYTGDETCEISCHGNPVLASQILSELVSVGSRPADRGEFTYRSFMNGRIDLVQAESVLSLIESSSKKATRLALEQLQGQLSQLFVDMEKNIVWLLSRIEAGIDFSSEGIELVEKKDLKAKLKDLTQTCTQLVESYKTGRLLSDGIKIAIAGKPNAGKSSLLNALIRVNRAIVSPIPGTTRDTVEATYKIKGVSATLIDTAGLRATEDQIEKLGVERALAATRDADLVLLVVDATNANVAEICEARQLVVQKCLVILNKIDLLNEVGRAAIFKKVEGLDAVGVSAEDGTGLAALEERLSKMFSLEVTSDTSVVIHARHEQQLRKTLDYLLKAEAGIDEELSPEFICLELREALIAIGQILGRDLDEDVISRIFKDFCIGK